MSPRWRCSEARMGGTAAGCQGHRVPPGQNASSVRGESMSCMNGALKCSQRRYRRIGSSHSPVECFGDALILCAAGWSHFCRALKPQISATVPGDELAELALLQHQRDVVVINSRTS